MRKRCRRTSTDKASLFRTGLQRKLRNSRRKSQDEESLGKSCTLARQHHIQRLLPKAHDRTEQRKSYDGIPMLQGKTGEYLIWMFPFAYLNRRISKRFPALFASLAGKSLPRNTNGIGSSKAC